MAIKRTHADMNAITHNLENTFDMASTQPVPVPIVKNNQLPIKPTGPGGKRAGAGRKLGSTNKIQGVEFLAEYMRIHGNSLKEDLARDMYNARMRGDYEMLFKYQTTFAKYYFADEAKTQVDVTSGGQPMQVAFQFPALELPDWNK